MTTAAGGNFAPSLKDALASESGKIFRTYLDMQEESEPPRMYLLWTLIAAAAALLGKNAVIKSGPDHVVTPNLFVVLLGPAGVRKTRSINMIRKLLEETSVNFGPSDTGGQRQGLMSALTGLHRPFFHGMRKHVDAGPVTPAMLHPREPSDIFLMAPELGRLFGSGSREMADFMVDLYDQAPIDYETKSGNVVVKAPLGTLLAATTPSSLASMIPENAGTHGVLSRMIFIYEDVKYKSVPIPRESGEMYDIQRESVLERLHWIDNNRLNFSMTQNAQDYYITRYEHVPELNDSRLDQYKERRADIMQRIGMAICALRGEIQVIESDFILAHEMLKAVEPKMHRALEYFGKNKIYTGRMLMLNYIRNRPDKAATKEELIAAAASELRVNEAEEALSGMVASGMLTPFASGFILGEVKNDIAEAKLKRKGRQPG